MRAPSVPLTLVVAVLVGLGSACATAAGRARAPRRRHAEDHGRSATRSSRPRAGRVAVRGPATILEAPEGGLAHRARRRAQARGRRRRASPPRWAAYKPDAQWPLKVANDRRRQGRLVASQAYYATRPRRTRSATSAPTCSCANDVWTVAIYDMAQAVGEKRGAQVGADLRQAAAEGLRARVVRRQEGAHARRRRASRQLAKFVETAHEAHRRAGRLGRPRAGRQGRVRRRLRRARARQAGEGRRRHALHDRVEHQGADDAAARQARRREEADVGHAGDDAAAVVQARRRRHDEPGAGQAPDLRLHRPAAPGLRVAASSSRASRRTARWRRSARCSRRASSASCSSTRTRWPRPPASSAATSRIPKLELGAAYDEAMQTLVFDPLGMTSTTFDFARALPGNFAPPHAPDIDGKPALAVMRAQLLDHPGASRRRRVEHRQRHAEVRADGARRGQAAGRQALHREGRAARAPRAAGRRSARTRPTAWA